MKAETLENKIIGVAIFHVMWYLQYCLSKSIFSGEKKITENNFIQYDCVFVLFFVKSKRWSCMERIDMKHVEPQNLRICPWNGEKLWYALKTITARRSLHWNDEKEREWRYHLPRSTRRCWTNSWRSLVFPAVNMWTYWVLNRITSPSH